MSTKTVCACVLVAGLLSVAVSSPAADSSAATASCT